MKNSKILRHYPIYYDYINKKILNDVNKRPNLHIKNEPSDLESISSEGNEKKQIKKEKNNNPIIVLENYSNDNEEENIKLKLNNTFIEFEKNIVLIKKFGGHFVSNMKVKNIH